MTNPLLARHPEPMLAESAFGYMLRVSEENGYPSPTGMMRFAGLNQAECTRRDLVLRAMATITPFPYDELTARLDSFVPTDAATSSILLRQIFKADAVGTESKFCPWCVNELGFIEAIWSLPLLTACTKHNCAVVYQCFACNKPIEWFRPTLLTCSCGADLIKSPRYLVSPAELGIVDLLRGKALRRGLSNSENPSALPLKEMTAMNLRTLHLTIKHLAKMLIVEEQIGSVREDRRVVRAASQVLSDWPHNFVGLISDFSSKSALTSVRAKAARLNNKFRPLFSHPTIARTRQTDFLQTIVLEFAIRHWGYADPKMVANLHSHLPSGHLYRLTPLSGIVAAISALPTTEISNSPESARLLGFPQDVFGALKTFLRSGTTELMPGYDLEDEGVIKTLKRDLLSLAPDLSNRTSDIQFNIPLGAALQWKLDTAETRARLVIEVLQKRIPVLANTDNTPSGLLIPRKAYESTVQDLRIRTQVFAVGAKESALYLGCSRDTVKWLFSLEVVRGTDGPSGLLLESQSLAEFKERYIFLHTIGKKFHCNAKTLTQRCLDIEINVYRPNIRNKASQQPFVNVKDMGRLTHRLDRILKPSVRAKSRRRQRGIE